MPPTRTHVRLLLLTLLLAIALAWPLPQPSAAAPAEAISTLFPGNLAHETTDPGPADALFTTLAAQAASTIDVALYDFDRASVREALLAAASRGLTVRVVGDNEAAANPSYAPSYTALQAAGIPVVLDTRSSLQHNKFAVFDDAVTWTGSANYSDTGFTRNGENVVVITSTLVAGIYATEFAEMFAGAFSTAKTDNTPHEVLVGTMPVSVAFAPTDGTEDRVVAALNSADVSLRVAMFTFTSGPLAQALIAAHDRGVGVEVLLDDTADGSQYSQRDPLCEAGVTVRVEDWPAKLHDKYAVVDGGTASDPLVITGSANWTASAARANDENVLIVHDAGTAAAFRDDFQRLRAAIGPEAFACNVETGFTVYVPVLVRDGAPPAGG
ncbi:MAG: phospholipase D-like domain-containing protein [Ardenticatenaceae bacterium]|nr:phospholipase D-like domain-containing protein [Ardenticatenaceae bacterium]